MSSGPDAPRFLAVLPARGGSKRIPRKNIRMFHGKPLIARTIQTVLTSGVFQDVIVSTDDIEIADVARKHGASVPFMRPASLSDDHTPTAPVIRHAIDELATSHEPYDAICCVYPGAVLLTPSNFSASSLLVHQAIIHNAVVAAVVKYGHPIQRALRQQREGYLVPVDQEAMLQRTQDLQQTWHDAGQFYWATPNRWRNPAPLLSQVIPYELPTWRAQDIDTEEDWTRAELIARLNTSI